ncbi:hypothetical protein NDU88_000017, partial [Pleurodeles waltl]
VRWPPAGALPLVPLQCRQRGDSRRRSGTVRPLPGRGGLSLVLLHLHCLLDAVRGSGCGSDHRREERGRSPEP